MTEAVKVLRIVVASPGDVQAERNAVEDVARDLNRATAKDRGLRVEVSRWETDAFPGFHADGAQGLVDSILKIEDCDVLVGIFWKRFGKPVGDAKSGTEHEFRTAYEAWRKSKRPQIMVYFNQKPYTPKSSEETAQMGLVLDFKKNFPKEGLWWPYTGRGNFRELLRAHLQNFLCSNFPVEHGPPNVNGPAVLMAAVPDVRVDVRTAAVGPIASLGMPARLMLVVTVQNHSPTVVNLQNVFLALKNGQQILFSHDAVSGELNTRRVLNPWDSFDFFMSPREVAALLLQHGDAAVCAGVRDCIGREYKSPEASMTGALNNLIGEEQRMG
jgi:Domain of unknown function (DUF4062)